MYSTSMHATLYELEIGIRVPIENIVCQTSGGSKRWVEAYRRFAKAGGQSVALHKQKLGRQDCVFTGEFRNWAWGRDRWTVLVSKRGVELSIPRETSMQMAWKLWRDYLQTLGLAPV